MSEVVFSKLTSFSTIELVSSSVDVEEYRVSAGFEESLKQIARSIKNRNFESGFMQLYVYDSDDKLIGVGYIEDWRAMCFPSDVVDSKGRREEHIEQKRLERLNVLKEETEFDDSWDRVVDQRDMMAGGGDYGQTQFFAIRD